MRLVVGTDLGVVRLLRRVVFLAFALGKRIFGDVAPLQLVGCIGSEEAPIVLEAFQCDAHQVVLRGRRQILLQVGEEGFELVASAVNDGLELLDNLFVDRAGSDLKADNAGDTD